MTDPAAKALATALQIADSEPNDDRADIAAAGIYREQATAILAALDTHVLVPKALVDAAEAHYDRNTVPELGMCDICIAYLATKEEA